MNLLTDTPEDDDFESDIGPDLEGDAEPVDEAPNVAATGLTDPKSSSHVRDLVAAAVDRAVRERELPSLLRPKMRRIDLEDPALLGFPPTLPIELALGEIPRDEILEAYSLTRAQWDVLRVNPVFQKAVKDAVEALQRDGMAFKVKARMQAEALLETSWALIHNTHTPSAVKADLIKHTHKMAGFEPKEEAKTVNPLQININLG